MKLLRAVALGALAVTGRLAGCRRPRRRRREGRPPAPSGVGQIRARVPPLLLPRGRRARRSARARRLRADGDQLAEPGGPRLLRDRRARGSGAAAWTLHPRARALRRCRSPPRRRPAHARRGRAPRSRCTAGSPTCGSGGRARLRRSPDASIRGCWRSTSPRTPAVSCPASAARSSPCWRAGFSMFAVYWVIHPLAAGVPPGVPGGRAVADVPRLRREGRGTAPAARTAARLDARHRLAGRRRLRRRHVDELFRRAAAPEALDSWPHRDVLLVLEATRRTVGWILPAICLGFLAYAYLGGLIPEALGSPTRATASTASSASPTWGSRGSSASRSTSPRPTSCCSRCTGRCSSTPAPPLLRRALLRGVRGERHRPGPDHDAGGLPARDRVGVRRRDDGHARVGHLAAAAARGLPEERGRRHPGGVGDRRDPVAADARRGRVHHRRAPGGELLRGAPLRAGPVAPLLPGILLAIEADARRHKVSGLALETSGFWRLLARWGYHFSSLIAIVVLLATGISPFRAVLYATVRRS